MAANCISRHAPRQPVLCMGAARRARCTPGIEVLTAAHAPRTAHVRPSFCPRRPAAPGVPSRSRAPLRPPVRRLRLAERGGACGGTRKRRLEAVSLATLKESAGPGFSPGTALASPGAASCGGRVPEPGRAGGWVRFWVRRSKVTVSPRAECGCTCGVREWPMSWG